MWITREELTILSTIKNNQGGKDPVLRVYQSRTCTKPDTYRQTFKGCSEHGEFRQFSKKPIAAGCSHKTNIDEPVKSISYPHDNGVWRKDHNDRYHSSCPFRYFQCNAGADRFTKPKTLESERCRFPLLTLLTESLKKDDGIHINILL